MVEDCILDFADVNHGLWIAGIWKGQKEVGVSERTKTDQKVIGIVSNAKEISRFWN